MQWKTTGVGAVAFLLVLIAVCPSASAIILMNVTGVQGDSMVTGYRNWTALTSFEITENLTFNQAVPFQGKPQMVLHISKPNGISSVQLLKKSLPVSVIPSVTIVFLATSGDMQGFTRYMQVEMTNVYITRYNMEGGEDARPMEDITLWPSIIRWRYYENSVLKYTAGWDNQHGVAAAVK